MNKQIKEKLWKESKHADEFPKDWIVIPTLDVIEIIENSQDCSGVELETAKESSDICNNILPDTIQYDEESNHSQENKSGKLHTANAVDKSCQNGFPDTAQQIKKEIDKDYPLDKQGVGDKNGG